MENVLWGVFLVFYFWKENEFIDFINFYNILLNSLEFAELYYFIEEYNIEGNRNVKRMKRGYNNDI